MEGGVCWVALVAVATADIGTLSVPDIQYFFALYINSKHVQMAFFYTVYR